MNKVNQILDRLLYWLLGYFFIVSIGINAKELLWYQIELNDILYWTAIVVLFYMVISWNKWTLGITGIVLVLAAIVTFFWFREAELLPDILNEIDRYYQIYRPAIAFNNGLVGPYQPAVIIGLIILTTILFDLLAIRTRALGLLTFLGLALMALNNEFGTLISRYVVYVLLAVQMLVYLLNMLKKHGNTGMYKQWLTLFIFTVLFTSSIYVLTTHFKDPLAFLESYDTFSIMERNSDESEIKLIYSNTERLVDGVRAGNTVVLTVDSNVDVYLKGTILSHFDGMTWYSNGKSSDHRTFYNQDDNNLINTINLDLYLNLLTTGHENRAVESSEKFSEIDPTILDYYVDRTVTVTYKALYTDVLFQPINTYRIFAADIEYQYNIDGFVVSTSKLPTDYQHTANYLMPLFNEEKMIDLMVGKENNGALDAFINSYNDNGFYTDYLAPYLIVPESITDRTKDLASELVSGHTDDYSKAKAIEKYLKSNYQYALVNLTIPVGGGDFVDYFLFESSEGYCTYFASAMAMMLRSEGIPARLVKGYVASKGNGGTQEEQFPGVPNFQATENASNETILVRDKDAHAWVEVFIEGFGWVPFEPTSGFSLNESVSEADEAVLTGFEDEEDTEEEISLSDLENKADDTRQIPITLVVSLLIPLILLVTYGILRILYQNKYKGRTIQESISWHEFFIRKILGVLYREKYASETLKMYYQGGALEKNLDQIDLNGYYNLLEKSYYSHAVFGVDDYNESIAVYQQVLRLYREKEPVKYWLLRLRYMV